MINFKNISYLTIPEGQVSSISINGAKVWKRAHVYGVHWDGGASSSMTRTDDAELFSEKPILNLGLGTGSSPFDSCYPWSDITVETVNGNELVKIPKFWFNWEKSGAAMTLRIADKPLAGYYVSPMHADREDGKGERDYAFIGRYKGNYACKSEKSYAVKISTNIVDFRNTIKSLGDGFYQQDYAAFWTLRMLFLVEWATWDGQSILTNTTDYSDTTAYRTGKVANISYHTGISSDGYNTQYRYVEDPWENVLEFIDGVYFSGTRMYCINNPENFATGSNGTLIGTRSTGTGYIKSWLIPANEQYKWALIPGSTNSSEAYTKDGYYYTSTGTVAYTGGTRSSWALHGPFYLYTDFTANSTSSGITCRLMYLP